LLDQTVGPRSSVLFLVAMASVIAFSACQPAALPELRTGHRVVSVCPSAAEGSEMFPPGFQASGAGITPEISTLIRHAGLAPLWCGEGPIEAYRLTWDRDFSRSLVAELYRADGRWSTAGVRFADPRQNPAERELRFQAGERVTREVPERTALEIIATFTAGKLWSTSRYDADESTGGAWVLEARHEGAYQVIPRTSGPHGELGEAALRLGRVAGVWPLPE
jgi:hypothetical protein